MAHLLTTLATWLLAALLLAGCESPGQPPPARVASDVGIVVPAALPTPIAAEVYGPIYAEAQQADWRQVGVDPVRYVEDRLNQKAFLTPLLNQPQTRVVLHRQALKISQVPHINPSRTHNVTHPDAKDYPGRVYWSPDDRAFHVVAIAGEDWFRQTLHMLANAGVTLQQIAVQGVFAPQALVAADLDPTLAAHDFDSVTIGPMGELGHAIERVLRQRERPAYAHKLLADLQPFLEARLGDAPPDKKPRWTERLQRLQVLRQQGGPALAQFARIQADPVLSGPLTTFIHAAQEGPPRQELPWSYSTENPDLLPHRIVQVGGKKHLIIHIGGAHGDLAYHAVRHILAKKPGLARVNVYGSAGSLSTQIAPDTFIRPVGIIRSLEADRGDVPIDNRAVLDGAIAVRHANVSTLLREHRTGLQRLAALPADSVDIESYHVARAVSEAGRPIDLRAILRISDVATSPELGAHRTSRTQTSNYDYRREGEERVVTALGLLPESP